MISGPSDGFGNWIFRFLLEQRNKCRRARAKEEPRYCWTENQNILFLGAG